MACVCVCACLSVRLNVTVCPCMLKPEKPVFVFPRSSLLFCCVPELVCTSVCVQVCLHGRRSGVPLLISVCCCQRRCAINGTPSPPHPTPLTPPPPGQSNFICVAQCSKQKMSRVICVDVRGSTTKHFKIRRKKQVSSDCRAMKSLMDKTRQGYEVTLHSCFALK